MKYKILYNAGPTFNRLKATKTLVIETPSLVEYFDTFLSYVKEKGWDVKSTPSPAKICVGYEGKDSVAGVFVMEPVIEKPAAKKKVARRPSNSGYARKSLFPDTDWYK